MEESNFYPPKPKLIERSPKSNWGATVFSIVLFILIFLFLFPNKLNFILALVLVLSIHEFGHFSMMKFFKYKHVRMLFVPLLGAFVHGKKEHYSQKESFFVVGAGPFPGIIIGFLLMIFSQQFYSTFMFQAGMLFFVLNIINLVPLDPLDGGQLFKLLVYRNQERFLMIFSLISSLIIIAIGFSLNSYLMMIFGFLMAFRVRSLQKNYHLHRELNQEDIPYNTTYKKLSNKDFWRIKQVVVENAPQLQQYIQQADVEEVNELMASLVNSTLVTPTKRDASFILKLSVVLLWIASLLSPLLLYFYLDLNWVNYAISNW